MKAQYLEAIKIFDSEHSRFWTRFNLFVGFQFIIIAGFASGFDKIYKFPSIGILFILIGLLFSIFNAFVVWRSYLISIGIAKTIAVFEEQDESLILLKTYRLYTKSALGDIVIICLLISGVLIVFWLFLFAIFVRTI